MNSRVQVVDRHHQRVLALAPTVFFPDVAGLAATQGLSPDNKGVSLVGVLSVRFHVFSSQDYTNQPPALIQTALALLDPQSPNLEVCQTCLYILLSILTIVIPQNQSKYIYDRKYLRSLLGQD